MIRKADTFLILFALAWPSMLLAGIMIAVALLQ